MAKKRFQPSEKASELLRASGSYDTGVSLPAMRELAKALETPLRQGILNGNILDGIFEVINLGESTTSEFPLDFLAPGTERQCIIAVDMARYPDAVLFCHGQDFRRIREKRKPADQGFIQNLCAGIAGRGHCGPHPLYSAS